MTEERLMEILIKHSKWLRDEDGGERANLRDADLRNADLRGIDLSHADLRGADFSRADLRGANLRGSELCGANFCNAILHDADFSYANLYDANLIDAKLRGANLTDAYLRKANFKFADLRRADFRSAYLSGADLRGVRCDDTALKIQCPEEGSFIAWKKLANEDIAKLLIPEDAERSSATTRKCRASKAIVLAIYDVDGTEVDEGRSISQARLAYRVGETVYPDSWDENRWNECSHGIHFFITRREAEEY